jgi:hypothetical protein
MSLPLLSLRVFHFEQTHLEMRDRFAVLAVQEKRRRAKGFPVEYRGIRYTVRARIERNEWTVSIHSAGIEGARRVVNGPRQRADRLARSMIDTWHERAPRAQRGAVNLYNREARRIAANIAKLPELVRR